MKRWWGRNNRFAFPCLAFFMSTGINDLRKISFSTQNPESISHLSLRLFRTDCICLKWASQMMTSANLPLDRTVGLAYCSGKISVIQDCIFITPLSRNGFNEEITEVSLTQLPSNEPEILRSKCIFWSFSIIILKTKSDKPRFYALPVVLCIFLKPSG